MPQQAAAARFKTDQLNRKTCITEFLGRLNFA